MVRVVVAFFVVAALSFSAKPPKPPQVAIVDFTVRRAEGKFLVDGRVKNISEKPLAGLSLVLDYRAPGSQVINSTKDVVETPDLAPQEESEFHAQTPEQARAVDVMVGAVDKGGREQRVDKPGPYSIE